MTPPRDLVPDDDEDIDPATILEEIRAACLAPAAPPEEMMTPEEGWATMAEIDQGILEVIQGIKGDLVTATKRRDVRAMSKHSRDLAGMYTIKQVMKILRRGALREQTRQSLSHAGETEERVGG